MARPTLGFECWKSDQNKHEIHFFLKDDQATYVAGFNPAFFTWTDVALVLEDAGFRVPEEAEEFWNVMASNSPKERPSGRVLQG